MGGKCRTHRGAYRVQLENSKEGEHLEDLNV